MSPLEYIEEGIRQGDWKIVCEGYERLTGKALPLPIESNLVNDVEKAFQQITNIASVTVSQLNKVFQSAPVKPEKISRKKHGRPKKKSTMTNKEEDTTLILNGQINTPVTSKTNGTQLITNQPDPKEIEKNKIKAIRAQQNKLKLNRQTAHTFDVKCNECENVFQSDRPDGELGQKCSRCLKEKKNRLI